MVVLSPQLGMANNPPANAVAPLPLQSTETDAPLFSFVRMKATADAANLQVLSDTVPVGPNKDGEILYLHVEPLNPATIAIIVVSILVLAIFAGFYFYPVLIGKLHPPPSEDGDTHRCSRLLRNSRLSWPSRIFARRSGGGEPTHGEQQMLQSQLLERRGLPTLTLGRPSSSFFTYIKSRSSLLTPPFTGSTLIGSDGGAGDYSTVRVHSAGQQITVNTSAADRSTSVVIVPFDVQRPQQMEESGAQSHSQGQSPAKRRVSVPTDVEAQIRESGA